MSADLSGSRFLITGGSRGLGRAIAVASAARGARVAFTYSTDDADAEEARRAVAAVGADPLVLKGSVADAAHARSAVDAVHKAWGGLDALALCAGVMQVLPISLLEETDWDLLMDVNVKGAYLFARAALRHMIRQKRGSILAIGTFASERIIEAPVHFAASKSALRGLVEALAREVGRHGVRVNLLAPGLLEQGLSQGLPQHRVEEYLHHAALHRLGTLAELAELAVFLLSDDASFCSGTKLVADGGL